MHPQKSNTFGGAYFMGKIKCLGSGKCPEINIKCTATIKLKFFSENAKTACYQAVLRVSIFEYNRERNKEK